MATTIIEIDDATLQALQGEPSKVQAMLARLSEQDVQVRLSHGEAAQLGDGVRALAKRESDERLTIDFN